MALATLDLSLFTNGHHDAREAFAADLREELSRHGFVKIVGHGLSNEDIGEVFEWVKQEDFDQGSAKDLAYPNKWPHELVMPGFRGFMESWYEKMEQVAARLMEALEHAFQLAPGSFLDRMTHEKNASEARLLHYPAIEIQEINQGAVSRIWPHFDLGVITLLFQDDVEGLECEDRASADTFFSVGSNSRSEMVVNVSETLQRWTNDSLPAGLHRVTVPKSFEKRECGMVPERYSVTYFCKADRDASVGPLPQFVSNGSEAKYDDVTAIEYHQSRLKSAY
ncbi:MAG: hypothetical protein Q9188_001198 [Gyalolechia gomerana]